MLSARAAGGSTDAACAGVAAAGRKGLGSAAAGGPATEPADGPAVEGALRGGASANNSSMASKAELPTV